MRATKVMMAILGVALLAGCVVVDVKVPPTGRKYVSDGRAEAGESDGRVIVKAPFTDVDIDLGSHRSKAKKIKAARWYNTDRKVELKKLRGRYVVLHFFRVEEGASQREVTDLVQRALAWPENRVAVVGLHPPVSGGTIERYLRRCVVTYPVAVDDEDETVDDYHIKHFPFTVLIGPDGTIVMGHEQLEQVAARLNELLALQGK